ncbi:MAG: caspase family protein [Bacteroidota bacterium]|nr:caspase family protein [Bacteroidota bacterium]
MKSLILRGGLLFVLLTFPGLGCLYGQTVKKENRVALVMGNATYLNAPLKNTVNDARAIAEVLKSSGFEVLLKENVKNQNEMKQVVREFGMKLKTGGTALFYYSGHGMQVNGYNYLIPTQAVMHIEQEIEYEALDMGFILAYMESARSDVNIVILDACRNNPFARSFRDTKQGLSTMVAPTGTLIAYSTSPGSVASDGDQDYGLYTRALLMHMQQPGVKVEEVFKGVRADVLQRSGGQQTPWESSSLVGDFYFRNGSGAGYTPVAAMPVQEQDQTIQNSPAEVQPNSEPVAEPVKGIPQSAYRKSGVKVPFTWKAMPDGTFYLWVDKVDISPETIYELHGNHLHVYHRASNRVFILKSFVQRLDGTSHRGVTYD